MNRLNMKAILCVDEDGFISSASRFFSFCFGPAARCPGTAVPHHRLSVFPIPAGRKALRCETMGDAVFHVNDMREKHRITG